MDASGKDAARVVRIETVTWILESLPNSRDEDKAQIAEFIQALPTDEFREYVLQTVR